MHSAGRVVKETLELTGGRGFRDLRASSIQCILNWMRQACSQATTPPYPIAGRGPYDILHDFEASTRLRILHV